MKQLLKRSVARVLRRARAHLGHLRIGLRDRVERRKSVFLERISPEGRFVQLSLVWSTRHFPADKLTNRQGGQLVVDGLGVARLGRAAGGRFRHFFWIELTEAGLEVPRFSGKPMALRASGGQSAADRWDLSQLSALTRPKSAGRQTPFETACRAYAQSPEARDRFCGAWVIMDRAERADDNGEHFYRFLQSASEADRIFFVLRPESPDWPRLEADGFRLLAFGSADHIAAVANAAIVASSQVSVPVFWPMAAGAMRDLVSYRFVFLQHGVIMNDLSDWLNQLPIDLIVTTTLQEYSALAGPETPYRFSPRDTVLAGLARHDALLARHEKRQWLTIAPTWRSWLVGQIDPSTMHRPHKSGFEQSDFLKSWFEVLSDPRLAALARAQGLQPLLLPHPNLRAALEGQPLPEGVTLYDPRQHGTYQDVMAASGLCLTDYSSLSMDMALLDIPVVYYQFDAERVLGGQHSIGPGYFDYGRDGFGPVTSTAEATFEALAAAFDVGNVAGFAERRSRAFVHRDQQNCVRLRAAILQRLLPPGS